jgi:hypothetical protein
MKSSWAYNNGKREMNKINESLKAPKRGWVKVGKIEAGTLYRYGERNKHNPKELVVKAYANKSQAQKMLYKLREEGVNCWFNLKWPFVIECTDFSGWDATRF